MSRIDINEVDLKTLTKLKAIGRVKAERIIDYRDKNGLFNDVKDLLMIKGIAEKILAKIKDDIVVKPKKMVKVVFNPEEYGLGEIKEVHLVGEMNNWDPKDYNYSLTKGKDGLWVESFSLEKGTEYKFMYDSNNWEDNKHIGNGLENLII